ncbi:cytochrome-c oxidase [Virgibacillus xinjiangensis]|uniref:Cytochrome-c oxidase n=1 Tax=Virgibacillus xinjiangensis TaxID=393090 RepID=A0ABV7CRA3_9BACI
MGERLIKISVFYFVVGVSFGLYMSVFHVYDLATVHVHINLLGWVSLAIAGIFYTLFPHLAGTATAKVHFWLHNLGLPAMMIGLALGISGVSNLFFPIASLGGVVTVAGIFCFGYNVFRHLGNRTENS